MNNAFPLKSIDPSLVVMDPLVMVRGQNACLIEPQGAFGSAPS